MDLSRVKMGKSLKFIRLENNYQEKVPQDVSILAKMEPINARKISKNSLKAEISA